MRERITAGFLEAATWMAAALLAGLPLVFLYLGWDQDLGRALDLSRSQEQLPLDKFRQQIQATGRLHLSLARLGEEILSLSRGSQDPLGFLQTEFSQLKAEFPNTFEVVTFDQEGRLVASQSDLPEFQSLLEDFGRDRVALVKGDGDPLLRNFHRYRPFLGYFRNRRRGDYSRFNSDAASFHRRRGFSFISSLKLGRPWFMFWVNLPEEVREVGVRFALRNRAKPTPDSLAGIIDLRESLEDQAGRMGAPQALHAALLKMGDEDDRCLFEGGWIWTQVVLSRAKRLVLGRPDHALISWEKARSRLLVGLALLFGAGTLMFRFWLSRAGSWSLRVKLVALFFYTSGVPLGLLALSARGLLQDRRELLVQQRFQKHMDTIQEASRLVTGRLSLVEAYLSQTLKPPLPDGPRANPTSLARTRRLLRHLNPDLCSLFDEHGNNLYKVVGGFMKEVNAIIPMLGMQAKRRIAEVNGMDPDIQDSTREQTIRASLESMGIDLEPFTAPVEESVEHFTISKIAKSSAQYLSFPMRDRAGKIRASLFILFGQSRLMDELPRLLEGFSRLSDEILIGMKDQNRYSPSRFTLYEEANQLEDLAREPGTAISQMLTRPQGALLLTGISLPDLDQNFFVAASTDRAIRADLSQLGRRLAATGFVLVCLGLGLGLVISRHFLGPIRRFGEGLAAIRDRRFDKRLPIEGDDELGRLAGTFNQVLEGMADLEVARIVQDTFFPRTPLQANGWEVFGTSESASRVGGDYFDYFPLPDGRWLLVIGDVTGHGVAASLGVAMAKAVVCHPGNPDRPSAILTLMNDMVMTTLEQTHMMTCFLAIFDPRDGRLTASNAGHNFPFVLRGDRLEEIDIRHPMLGFKTRKPFEDRVLQLQEGDRLCLYTDGLVEAVTREGGPIGYPEFKSTLLECRGAGARETHAVLRAWHAGRRETPTLEDDATLIILQHLDGGPQEVGQPGAGGAVAGRPAPPRSLPS